MKANFSFELPEEQFEFNCVCYASKIVAGISDYQEKLRQKWKYSDDLSEKEIEIIDWARRELTDSMDTYCVDLANLEG